MRGGGQVICTAQLDGVMMTVGNQSCGMLQRTQGVHIYSRPGGLSMLILRYPHVLCCDVCGHSL
jgi:hypothetical protein